MAKEPAEPKSPALKSEESFVELMLVAADFVKSSGGMEQAKKSRRPPANSSRGLAVPPGKIPVGFARV